MIPSAFVRAVDAAIVDHGASTTVLATDGSRHAFTDGSAELVRAMLAFTTTPVTRDAILAHVAALTATVLDEHSTSVVDQAVARLVASGALVSAASRGPAGDALRTPLVLGITGAVASAMSPQLVLALQARGYDVSVAATRAALRFVTARTLAALTHHPVVSSFWTGPHHRPAPHVQLAQFAHVVLVCPASASTLARLASGDSRDVVSAMVCATRAPVIVAPSMNPVMFDSPAVQRAIQQLRSDGRHVVWPSAGIEVAQSAGARRRVHGPAPSPDRVADVVDAVMADQSRPIATAEEWDRVYADPNSKWWEDEPLETGLTDAIDSLPTSARVLDIGTGRGAVAAYAGRRGLPVVAIDHSREALARATQLHHDLPITWILDDFLASRSSGTFDLVVDRKFFHGLPATHHAAYARGLAARVRPGGRAVVVTDAVTTRGTVPLDETLAGRICGRSLTVVSQGIEGTSSVTVFARRP